MQKNDIYDIEITGMTDDGDGVGRADGMAVFVPYTIVGEKARVLIVKVMKNFAYGKLMEIITPSMSRVKAECPYFYKCGGCQLWHMDMDAELEYKRQKVEECLKRLGGIDVVPEKVVDTGIYRRYRNKAQYPVTKDGTGFYKRNSHVVIPIDDCLIQGENDKAIISAIRKWMEEYDIPAYDEEKHQGFLRNIYIREGKEELIIVLVTLENDFPFKKELIDKLLKLDIPIAGIVQNINDKRTNVVLGKENKTLYGRDYLVDLIGDVSFKISPQSFYQVNRFATKKLYEVAGEMAELSGEETLWDIYCGIGTIGQFLAKKVKKIIGIEVVPEAVENAKENAKNNGILNAKYHCGKAEFVMPRVAGQGERTDVVILDPPRKGCDEKLLKTVLELKPKKIIYISCKPSTLARDLKYLTGGKYEVKRVVPVNMFPKGAHVESVALLTPVKR